MTDKELQKLNRRELLEMLIEQTKEVDRLQQELEETKARLESRDLMVNKAGSFAQAAFQINGVVESVEAAARQYLENIKRCSDSQQAKYESVIAEARAKADEIIAEAEKESKLRKADADEYWQQLQMRLDAFYAERKDLRDLLLRVDKVNDEKKN